MLKISKKDNSTFVINKDVLENNKDVVLTENKGELTINNGFTQIPITLSEDKKTIYIQNEVYNKVDDKTAETLKKNDSACKELLSKYAKESGSIFGDKLESLNNNYRELEKNIPNCNLSRWF